MHVNTKTAQSFNIWMSHLTHEKQLSDKFLITNKFKTSFYLIFFVQRSKQTFLFCGENQITKNNGNVLMTTIILTKKKIVGIVLCHFLFRAHKRKAFFRKLQATSLSNYSNIQVRFSGDC